MPHAALPERRQGGRWRGVGGSQAKGVDAYGIKLQQKDLRVFEWLTFSRPRPNDCLFTFSLDDKSLAAGRHPKRDHGGALPIGILHHNLTIYRGATAKGADLPKRLKVKPSEP